LSAPEYGDVIWIDFDPQVGHEQAKRRPALVLSQQDFNEEFGLAFVCPISTKPKGNAFEVPFPAGHAVKGAVFAHQLKSFDWRERRADRICSAPEGVVAEAADIVRDIIRS
jgi:mRNA interferase MazF